MNTYAYRNKYKKSFLDSSAISGMMTKSDSEKLGFNIYEFQDPTILGFQIHFDFEERSNIEDYDNLPNSLLMPTDDVYSAYQYLLNINEPIRANYLKKFINILKNIQINTPWYFQTISGLDKLQTIDPGKGWRLTDDTTLTIDMLESIDLRISLLIDLYRKAAWDPIYNRWMLPENMRWFKVKIVVAEIRDFQIRKRSLESFPQSADPIPELGTNARGNSLDQVLQQSSTATKVNSHINRNNKIAENLNLLENPDGSMIVDESMQYENTNNSFLPMHVFKLDMCEFSFLNRGHSYLSSVQTGEYGSEASQQIVFKVGRVVEMNDYSLQNILLREDSLRQMSSSLQIVSPSMKSALLNTEDVTKQITHNESNSNFIKDKLINAATIVANSAIDGLIGKLFLGNAFDGALITSLFKKEKESAAAALAQRIVTLQLGGEIISGDDTKNNITTTGHSYLKSQYNGSDKIELKQGSVQTSEDTKKHIAEDNHSIDDNMHTDTNNLITEVQITKKMPANIGFELPEIKIETLSNIGFNK